MADREPDSRTLDFAGDVDERGRKLRNRQVPAITVGVFNPAIAAGVIASAHTLVAELFYE